MNYNASRVSEDGWVIIISDRFRDQKKNVDDCIAKLEQMIEKARQVPKKRKKTKPTKSSKVKRLEFKKRHSAKKQMRQRHQAD